MHGCHPGNGTLKDQEGLTPGLVCRKNVYVRNKKKETDESMRVRESSTKEEVKARTAKVSMNPTPNTCHLFTESSNAVLTLPRRAEFQLRLRACTDFHSHRLPYQANHVYLRRFLPVSAPSCLAHLEMKDISELTHTAIGH